MLIAVAVILSLVAILLLCYCTADTSDKAERFSDGPIDVVVTFVDDKDEEWASQKRAAHSSHWDPTVNNQDSAVGNRFRNMDELKYCLRSIDRYIPWINRIFLVVASPRQVPSYIDTSSPRLSVVTHSDFMPPECLPTFNSLAIEANLHKIEGLSDVFLYFNDDMFLGKPHERTDFIGPEGKLKFFPDGGRGAQAAPKGVPTANEPSFRSMWKNANRYLDITYRPEERQVMCHSPSVLSKAMMSRIWDAMPEEMNTTSMQKFRSIHDHGMTCALHQWISWYEQTGHLEEPKPNQSVIVELGGDQSQNARNLGDIKKHPRGAFCLNDSDSSLSDSTRLQVLVFLEEMFPQKSSVEK